MNIGELKVGMKNIDIRGKIVEKAETREVYSRYGFNVHRVSQVQISDDSGSIKLILWNNQIDSVSAGDTIQIENGYVSQFRGVSQLNVRKRDGKISVVKE
ncbi:DNA-binding protein [Candidatus Bathyarchaeota archaeon]|nr:MAG: DNA-binding protein [Candidatus Bathyarchaeota archaeon]